MPIIINNFKWKQSHDSVIIHVPIKISNRTKADIFISSRYIKITYEKYFFEAILFAEIDHNACKCTITCNEAVFDLKKHDSIDWPSLEPNIPKDEKLRLKKVLLEESYNLIQKNFEDSLNKKAELKRVAVRQQIETDSKLREEIDFIRKREEAEALGDINSWRKTTALKAKQRHKQVLEKKSPQTISEKIKNKTLPETVNLRTPKTIEIEFTPREFPTPCRESKLEEENEWLANQAEARRSAGFISDDIRPEERNPQFLKAKGDEFMRNKNYLGAISAYSFGIKLSSNFVDLYISRAEAHLALGNYHKVLLDCSTALDLLKPEVPANQKERALCIGRRGVALINLAMKKQGIEELNYSLNLSPNEEFQKVLETERLNP